ncbi:competence/damage-inducible protein A [Nitrospira sp. Kam-Ns4a]
MKRGAVIAVGAELLVGGRAETNSLFLARRLAAAGIEVRVKLVVGDDAADIADAVRQAARRADVVVLTGGLGPTRDDCTREGVARATGRPLRRRAEALAGLRERLASWGRPTTPVQERQARLPAGAEVLPNPTGLAPGFALRWRGALIVALPGVPSEVERMWEEAVAPRLLAARPRRGRAGALADIAHRVLHTFGLPEAELDCRLHALRRGLRTVRLGLLASPLGVDVVLTALPPRGASRLDRLARAVRRKVGDALFGEGEETMEQVVGRLLTTRGFLLAVAESCTGGLIGHRLTQVPGSSAYLDRVLVSYSNRAKTELLGVPESVLRRHGAVSAEVAAAMARGVRALSRVQVGLSVTGIAGPGGATAGKPVGLVYVGLDVRAGRTSHRTVREFRFHGEREAIKLRASQAALNVLRLWLTSEESSSISVHGEPVEP